MWETINNVIYNIHFGPHQRRVEKYLDEATTDSVLNDLGQVLRSKASEVRQLSSLFEAHCFTDGGERFWTKESLKQYIETNHPGITLTEPPINLLWRCFHFYAYHPFPCYDDVHQINESAFQRAVILLAARGTDLLGTQDGGDYFWRNDTEFFRDADFRRILRSISRLQTSKYKSQPTMQMSAINDVMDVLATTQPYTVTVAPSPDLLESTARRLLECAAPMLPESVPVKNELRADDFSALITLLLQLKVHGQKWGTSLHYGEFHQRSRCEELARSITTGIFMQGSLDSNTYCKVIDVLPNLRIQFYQLWAVLFQPVLSNASLSADIIPSDILQTISLFTPPLVSGQSPIFHIPTQQLTASNDLTIIRLVKALQDDIKHSHIALFVNDMSSNVFGAYFPVPLSQPQEYKIARGHLLFQLAPQFCLLRWTGQSIPLTDLINVRDASLLMSPSALYRIGALDDEGNSAGLWIDPDTRSVQLIKPFTTSGRYEVLCESLREDDNGVKGETEGTKIDRLYILHVSTFEMDAELSFKKDIETKYRAPSVQADQLIRGAKLQTRIQGFGSPL